MLFHSLSFVIFFVVIYSLYLVLDHKRQKWLLLLANFIFYAVWDWRFLPLILISPLLGYICGLKISEARHMYERQLILFINILVNLTILGIFKYYNFFASNLQRLLNTFGLLTQIRFFELVLPLGISFYTFQVMSYTIDVYRGHIKPTKNFLDLALYITFFPLLAAGPIERAGRMLPQFEVKRTFDYESVAAGFKLFAWGLFKKVVIADRLAVFVNYVYNNPFEYQGISLIVATVFFTFQLFCDFSAYSDMAVGIARVMGYELIQNFNHPFSAASVSGFWRRWHVSLTTWITDYVYMPLALQLRDWGNFGVVVALTGSFFLVGLWHGAGWTYITFGLLHGIVLSLEVLTRKARKILRKSFAPFLYNTVGTIFTFCFFSFSLIFFRSKNMNEAFYIASHLFSGLPDFLTHLNEIRVVRQNILLGQYKWDFVVAVSLICVLECVHFVQRKYGSIAELTARLPVWLRWPSYYAFVLSIMFLGVFNQSAFIYFQF